MHRQEWAPFISNCLQKLQEGCCNPYLRLASSGMCSPFLSSLGGCSCPSLSVAFSLLSLLLPLSSFPVFLLTGRIIFPFVTKKTGQKERALFCGNTLVIFFALHQILFTSCHQKNQQSEMCSTIAPSAGSCCLFCVCVRLLSLHIHQAHACISLEKCLK